MARSGRLGLAASAAVLLHLALAFVLPPFHSRMPASLPVAEVRLTAPAAHPAPPSAISRQPLPLRHSVPQTPATIAAMPIAVSTDSQAPTAIVPAVPMTAVPASVAGFATDVMGAVAQQPVATATKLPSRPPVCNREPKPQMPALSRELGESGRVVLRLVVGETGGVQVVRWVARSGFARLDSAALEAARQWHCRPALKNGAATAAELEETVVFELEN